jgi:hypothetical protein
MADERETQDEGFDYPALVRAALLGVVRQVLARTADEGLPGEHHLYLTFGTADEGVEVPAHLRRQYPDEITIVLQHQFWNLAADEHGFAVTLRFGGKPERLVVPWASLRGFADPSVEFGFRLVAPAGEAEEQAGPVPAATTATKPTAADTPAAEPAKVVRFGAFKRPPRS